MTNDCLLPDHLHALFSQGRTLRSSGYRGRFAPSPTGVLHLGNLSTALLSWLEARLHHGVWLLRIDDLDTPRCKVGAVEAIKADLDWLGLHWDGPVIHQSHRRGTYYAVLSWLKRSGALFPCRCSRRVLAGQTTYPGTCRERGHGWGWEQQRLPSWRLRVPDADPHHSGDVIVRRADGYIAYQLATVIDEICFGISDVVRGDDLRDALPAQLSLFSALSCPAPNFRHGPLVLDDQGRKLSKREASAGLLPLQQAGLEAPTVIGRIAFQLGMIDVLESISAGELLDHLTHQGFRGGHS